MKNSTTMLLVALTLAFAAFIGGFYLGRSTSDRTIELSTETTAPRITFPSQDSTQPPENTRPQDGTPSQPSFSDPTSSLIDINTATLEELDKLPGIGPSTAQKIIDYRNQFGPFQTVYDLLEVDNIGTKTLEKIIDLITV